MGREGIEADVGSAVHGCALEFLVLELFHRSAEISGRLELHEAGNMLDVYSLRNSDQIAVLAQSYPFPSRSRPTSE